MKKTSEGGFEMIEKIPDLPNNIHGFAAKGTITAYDYRSVIIPAVEELFSRKEKVRLKVYEKSFPSK